MNLLRFRSKTASGPRTPTDREGPCARHDPHLLDWSCWEGLTPLSHLPALAVNFSLTIFILAGRPIKIEIVTDEESPRNSAPVTAGAPAQPSLLSRLAKPTPAQAAAAANTAPQYVFPLASSRDYSPTFCWQDQW